MVELIKQAIESEMKAYATVLHKKLEQKYIEEFNEEMRKRRNELVLEAVDHMKIESKEDMLKGELKVSIHL